MWASEVGNKYGRGVPRCVSSTSLVALAKSQYISKPFISSIEAVYGATLEISGKDKPLPVSATFQVVELILFAMFS